LRCNWKMEGASLWNPMIWKSKASQESEVAWEVHRVCVAQVWHENRWYTTCSSPWHRPEVQTNNRTNNSACGLNEESSSDLNDLQGDGHASTEEHGVGDFQNLEHRCVWGGIVNHQDRGSAGALTDCGGVLQKWDHLRFENGCQNGAFQHPWWEIHWGLGLIG